MNVVDFWAPALEAHYGFDYARAATWVREQQYAAIEEERARQRPARGREWQRHQLVRLNAELTMLQGEMGAGRSKRQRRFTERSARTAVRFRRTVGNEPTGIKGTAAVFNEETVIGGVFIERIAPGAFDHTLDSDVVALFNHDPNIVLGRTPYTLQLSSDEFGLHYEITDMPDSRADVLEAIRRGDIRGNSFSFDMDPEKGAEEEFIERPGRLPLRTIRKVGRLFDVGPVLWPAYPTTSVGARGRVRR